MEEGSFEWRILPQDTLPNRVVLRVEAIEPLESISVLDERSRLRSFANARLPRAHRAYPR